MWNGCRAVTGLWSIQQLRRQTKQYRVPYCGNGLPSQVREVPPKDDVVDGSKTVLPLPLSFLRTAATVTTTTIIAAIATPYPRRMRCCSRRRCRHNAGYGSAWSRWFSIWRRRCCRCCCRCGGVVGARWIQEAREHRQVGNHHLYGTGRNDKGKRGMGSCLEGRQEMVTYGRVEMS